MGLDNSTVIIILNWNNAKDTVSCLESMSSINDQHSTKFAVVVVDNGSDDDSLVAVRRWFAEKGFQFFECDENNISQKSSKYFSVPWAILKGTKNRGYAGGNNLGLKFALTVGFGRILILNNDAVFSLDSLEKMVHYLVENPDVGIVGPVVIDRENGQVQSAGKRLDTLFGHHVAYKTLPLEGREVGYVSGCCMLIRSTLLKKIGFLEESFCLYTEDVELCYRASKTGAKVMCLPSSEVLHSSHGSLSDTKERIGLRLYFQLRNNMLFARLHLRGWNRLVYQLAVLCRAIKHININFWKGSWSVIGSILKGVWCGFVGIGGCPWLKVKDVQGRYP